MPPSRRELLLTALAYGPALFPAVSQQSRILAAPDLLSQESAAGYRATFAGRERIHVVIGDVPSYAFKRMSVRAHCGEVLIRELAPSFGNFSSTESLYVRYQWPKPFLIRSFGQYAAFQKSVGEPIAFLGAKPVAWKESAGRGSVITLASMLGPHLAAGDREAQALLAALIREC
jgi:hypothetical protein